MDTSSLTVDERYVFRFKDGSPQEIVQVTAIDSFGTLVGESNYHGTCCFNMSDIEEAIPYSSFDKYIIAIPWDHAYSALQPDRFPASVHCFESPNGEWLILFSNLPFTIGAHHRVEKVTWNEGNRARLIEPGLIDAILNYRVTAS